MGKDESFAEVLEASKRASVGQLLFRCARLFNEQALAQLRAHTKLPGLRVTHTTILPHIDLEGTRLTELARRLGVSKQAVGQLVSELEVMGMLERVADPSDGRARLVRFSEEGRRGILEGLDFLRKMEFSLGEQLGHDQMTQLHDILLNMLPILEADALEIS